MQYKVSKWCLELQKTSGIQGKWEGTENIANLAKKHQNSLTKPKGSLGKLEKYAIWMAGWQKKKSQQ